MTDKERTAFEVILRNRVSQKLKQIGEAKRTNQVDTSFIDWLREDLTILTKISHGLKTDTIGKMLVEDNYGQLWETWMTIKGLSEEI